MQNMRYLYPTLLTGPSNAFEGPVSKVGYKYRMFCIIQSNNDKDLHNSASGLIKALDKEKRTISNWVLDVDPINVT